MMLVTCLAMAEISVIVGNYKFCYVCMYLVVSIDPYMSILSHSMLQTCVALQVIWPQKFSKRQCMMMRQDMESKLICKLTLMISYVMNKTDISSDRQSSDILFLQTDSQL